ncbi:MAG: glutathione S-transferase family protein [Cellvibrionaceae bacterium]
MITLYSFGPAFGVGDPSPFVLKIDALLRFTGIPYRSIASANNLNTAPKKKLPYIEDDGVTIADSYFILHYLQEKYNPSIDDHLSEEEKAHAHLMMRSLDENFYWLIVYSRWMKEDTWPLIKNTFFGGMPLPLRLLVPKIAKSSVKKNLLAQGFGKHTEEELLEIFKHSLNSLSTLLGNKPYFFGNKISSFDATAYACLASVISVNFTNSFNETANNYNNLVEYCQRIEKQYYSE